MFHVVIYGVHRILIHSFLSSFFAISFLLVYSLIRSFLSCLLIHSFLSSLIAHSFFPFFLVCSFILSFLPCLLIHSFLPTCLLIHSFFCTGLLIHSFLYTCLLIHSYLSAWFFRVFLVGSFILSCLFFLAQTLFPLFLRVFLAHSLFFPLLAHSLLSFFHDVPNHSYLSLLICS